MSLDIESMNNAFAGARLAREAREKARAEEDAARKKAEEEANKGFIDKAIDLGGEIVSALGESATLRANVDLQTAQQTAEFTSNTINNVSEAWDNANFGDAWSRFTNAKLFSGEAIDAAADLGGKVLDLGEAATREARYEIGDVIDFDARHGSVIEQNIMNTSTYVGYFMSDEKKLLKAQEIEQNTGIKASEFLDDDVAFKQAMEVNDFTVKQKEIMKDRFSWDDVWAEYPELKAIATMNPQEAAIALHNIDDVRTTHGIVDSAMKMFEHGNKTLELNNIQYKIMQGKATYEEKKRADELQRELEKNRTQAPSFLEDPLGAVAGGVAGSMPLMMYAARNALDDAALWAMAGMQSGAAIGSVVPGMGTAAGAAGGGLIAGGGRFMTSFIGNLAANSAGRGIVTMLAANGAREGMATGLIKPLWGESYDETSALKDENGQSLLTMEDAKFWSLLRAGANTFIEMAPLSMELKAVAGTTKAFGSNAITNALNRVFLKKTTGDIIKNAAAAEGERETLRQFALSRGLDMLKVTAAESTEEGLQSISDDVVHNMIMYDTGDTSNGVYTFEDMANRGLTSALEAMPGAFGFGLMAGAGGFVTGAWRRNRSAKKQAAFETKYVTDARKTIIGADMYGQLQETMKSNKLKQKSVDTHLKVLREQLKDTGFENVYIDVEMALSKEGGMEDLQKVAKASGMSDEELQTAIEEKGHIMVKGETFAQAESSPELLESVSFAPEADSVARMNKDAKTIISGMREMEQKTIEQQKQLIENILDEYFPADEKGKNRDARLALTAAIMENPANPAQGWNAVYKEYRQQLDEILAPALKALREGMGDSGILEVEDEVGNASYIRYSGNAPWYRDFYKEHKRRPTKAEMEEMAIAMVTGDPAAPEVLGWRPDSAETAAAMAEMKPTIDAIRRQLDTLDSIKSDAKELTGVEMELTQGLSKEAFHVYRAITEQLRGIGGATARAARMDAILFARHADIVAKIISDKTGKKYTATDYMSERYGLDVNGKYQGTLHQKGEPAFGQTSPEEIERQISVKNELLNSEPAFSITDNPLDGLDKTAIKEYFKENYQTKVEGQRLPIPAVAYTKNGDKVIITVNGTYKEIIRHSADKRVLRLIPHLREIIGSSILLYEEKPKLERIKKNNGSTLAYKQYGCKISLDGENMLVRSTLRIANDGGYYYDVNIDNFELKKKDSSTLNWPDDNSGAGAMNPSKSASIISDWIKNVNRHEAEKRGKANTPPGLSPVMEPDGRSSRISIRDMLRNVKGSDGEIYAQTAYHGSPYSFDRYNQEANQSGIKGSIGATVDGRRIISLFESADESTFAHEMSHMFLMDLEELAKIDEASAKELELVNDWAEWKRGAAKEYKGTPWAKEFATREQQIIDAEEMHDSAEAERLRNQWRQERFARAFELYLRDGRAPVKGLRAVFRKFKQFLRTIYIAFASDGGRASEPVRRVMDRMIATEEEIKAAELDDRYRDITKAGGEKLLTETEEETYQRWYDEAREEAKEKLLKVVMADLEEKKVQEYDERIAGERARKEKELQQEKFYLAYAAYQECHDLDVVLNWYDSWKSFLKEADTTLPLEEALDEYMADYQSELDAELIDSHITDEEVAKAMRSSEYTDKLKALETTALAKKMALVNTINAKTERAMQSLDDKLTALPQEVDLKLDKGEKSVKAVMEAINRLRFSKRWSAEDYRGIEKLINAATKEELEKQLKDFKEGIKKDAANEQAVLEANEGRMKIYREMALTAIYNVPLADACNYRFYTQRSRMLAAQVRQRIKDKDWQNAIWAQQQSAAMAARAVEAKKIRDKVDKRLKAVQRQLNTRSVRLPKDERYWHRHLAYMLGIAKSDAQMPESGVVELNGLFKNAVDSLDIADMPTTILDIAAKKGEEFTGYQSLTLDEFNEAIDSLTAVYTMGRDKFQLKSVGGLSIKDVVDNMVGDLAGINPEEAADIRHGAEDPYGIGQEGAERVIYTTEEEQQKAFADKLRVYQKAVEDSHGGLGYSDTLHKIPVIGEKLAQLNQRYISSMSNIEDILEMISPIAHRYIYGMFAEASRVEGEYRAAQIKAVEKIMSRYSHKEREQFRKKQYWFENASTNTDNPGKGRGEMLTKENVLCMALNMGSVSNRRRLIMNLNIEPKFETGELRTPAAVWAKQEQQVLDFLGRTMTAKDWEVVQDFWDLIQSYWPETCKVEEKLNGIALEKIPAKPFEIKTADGKTVKLKGGYYPVKYHPGKSSKAAEQEENIAAQSTMAGAQRLSIGRGMTKSRVEGDVINRPLLLEFGVLTDHLQAVIHNISWRLPVRDVMRLTNHRDFESYVSDHLGGNYHQLIKQWVSDQWAIPKDGSNAAASLIESTLASFRRNSTNAIMGYRVWTALENISNIGPVMDKLGAVKTIAAIKSYYTNREENLKLLYKSTFMRNRVNSMDRDIKSQDGLFAADPLPFEIIRSHAYDFMLLTDLALSAPLWVQSYKDAYLKEIPNVDAENKYNIARAAEIQAEVDAIKAGITNSEKSIADGERAMDLRRTGTPEQFATEFAGSPFEVMNVDELRSYTAENWELNNDARKRLYDAEERAARIQEIKILSDDEILEEAQRRAVAKADKAVRETFGSGETKDLSSMQRSKSELVKLMTTFYSFFNTQFNALYKEYRRSKFANEGLPPMQRWAPFARSMMYRVFLTSLIGISLKYALGLDGDDDKDKYRKVKDPETGKEVEEEIPVLERFLRSYAKYTLSTISGGFVGVRDFATLGLNWIFDGTTYGRDWNPMSTAGRSMQEFQKVFSLLARKGQKDLEIQEQEQKRELAYQERLKKLKGKKREEAISKHEEDEKYRKPVHRITYSEIARHAGAAIGSTPGIGAAYSGLSSTLVDSITTTMMYLNDDDNRYDPTFKNIVWSAIFDKKPVEREVPKRPPKQADSGDKEKKKN